MNADNYTIKDVTSCALKFENPKIETARLILNNSYMDIPSINAINAKADGYTGFIETIGLKNWSINSHRYGFGGVFHGWIQSRVTFTPIFF
jgi:hypothetical protein